MSTRNERKNQAKTESVELRDADDGQPVASDAGLAGERDPASPPPSTYRDAIVLHPERLPEAFLERPVKINCGVKRDANNWVLAKDWKVLDLVNVLTEHTVGKKDGRAILQGHTPTGKRIKTAMTEMFIAGIDVDCGIPLQPVLDRISELGLFAVLYTTHSHLSTESEINEKRFIDYAREHDFPDDPPTREGLARFLRDVLKYIPEIADAAEYVGPIEGTANLLIKHAPMPKFRLVFPLAEPFMFSDQRREFNGTMRKMTQPEAHDRWRKKLIGLAKSLDVPLDKSCTDPSRLFYLPRHPKGAKEWAIYVTGGDPLDFDKVPEHDDRARGSSDPFAVAADSMVGRDSGGNDEFKLASGTHLREWAREHAAKFQIVQLFEDHQPDLIRNRVSPDKIEVACPFDDEHSNPGDENDRGTFVCNGGSEDANGKGFKFQCQHSHCSGRDRLHYLKKAIDDEWFEESLLTDPTYTDAILSDDDQAAEAASAENDPYTFDDPDAMMSALNEFLGVVTVGDKVRILHQHDRKFDLLTKTDASILLEPYQLVEKKTKKGAKGRRQTVEESNSAFAHWLASPERRVFPNGICFEPGQTHDGINFDAGTAIDGAFNVWRGFAIAPKPGDWSLFDYHLRHVICRDVPEHYLWLKSWMAQLVQQPGNKQGTSVVLHSEERGTGKSTVGRWLSPILGEHACSVSQERHVTGNFNAHMGKTVLLICEESFWAGSKAGEGVMKDLITGDTIMLEHKGVDATPVRNHMRLLICSNNEWIVPAGANERRFFVLDVSPEYAKDEEYFNALQAEFDNGGPAAMLHDLLNWDWRAVNLRNPPETESLSRQKQLPQNPALDWWTDVLESAEFYLRDGGTAECFEKAGKPCNVDRWQDNWISVRKEDVFESLDHYIERTKGRGMSQRRAQSFMKAVAPGLSEQRPRSDHDRKRHFVFPPLRALREHAYKCGFRRKPAGNSDAKPAIVPI